MLNNTNIITEPLENKINNNYQQDQMIEEFDESPIKIILILILIFVLFILSIWSLVQ